MPRRKKMSEVEKLRRANETSGIDLSKLLEEPDYASQSSETKDEKPTGEGALTAAKEVGLLGLQGLSLGGVSQVAGITSGIGALFDDPSKKDETALDRYWKAYEKEQDAVDLGIKERLKKYPRAGPAAKFAGNVAASFATTALAPAKFAKWGLGALEGLAQGYMETPGSASTEEKLANARDLGLIGGVTGPLSKFAGDLYGAGRKAWQGVNRKAAEIFGGHEKELVKEAILNPRALAKVPPTGKTIDKDFVSQKDKLRTQLRKEGDEIRGTLSEKEIHSTQELKDAMIDIGVKERIFLKEVKLADDIPIVGGKTKIKSTDHADPAGERILRGELSKLDEMGPNISTKQMEALRRDVKRGSKWDKPHGTETLASEIRKRATGKYSDSIKDKTPEYRTRKEGAHSERAELLTRLEKIGKKPYKGRTDDAAGAIRRAAAPGTEKFASEKMLKDLNKEVGGDILEKGAGRSLAERLNASVQTGIGPKTSLGLGGSAGATASFMGQGPLQSLAIGLTVGGTAAVSKKVHTMFGPAIANKAMRIAAEEGPAAFSKFLRPFFENAARPAGREAGLYVKDELDLYMDSK